jgi:hypothetical protein
VRRVLKYDRKALGCAHRGALPSHGRTRVWSSAPLFKRRIQMKTISSKLTALAAAVLMNGLIMGAVGYLFEVQSNPQLSVIAFARKIVAYQWFV